MSFKNIILIILTSAAIYLYMTFGGDRPAHLVSAMVMASEKENKNLDIDFHTPVRYAGHFPETHGDLFQIQLRPITIESYPENYSMMNTFLTRNLPDDANLLDIRYEGDVPGGPLIVLHFKKPVEFKIKEADGLRGLHISYKPVV